MDVIRVENLEKTYSGILGRNQVRALAGVDISVKQGEIFGLLGPNGAGKTTLVKILLGIAYATQGKAFLFGENAANARSRDRVGYLPERHKYPRFLKGGDILEYYAKLSGMGGSARREAIPRLLKMVRMEEWQKTKMGKYSKGMAQRIGIAAAMISNPDLLVFDEPTDGVDPIGRKEIRDILIDLKKQGKTIFLNSHLLGEVEMVCDKVVVLSKGKKIVEGPIDELTNAGENSFIIEVSEISDSVGASLKEKNNSLEIEENELSIICDDVSDLNAFIDAIRAEGVLIEEIRKKRLTLEDKFIDAIQQAEGEASVQ